MNKNSFLVIAQPFSKVYFNFHNAVCMYLYKKVSYNLFVLQYFKQKDSRPENSGREVG